jgi:hypothetical protein
VQTGALLALLDKKPPRGGLDAVATAAFSARPSALTALRALCTSGADVAQHLALAGARVQSLCIHARGRL